MILTQTKLISSDNTDVRKVRAIKILGSSKKKVATLGDMVRSSVISRWHRKNIIKKKIYYSLIISIKKKKRRLNGSAIRFDSNRILTFSEQLKFLGTRIYGPICKEIRNTQKKRILYKKVVSLAQQVL